MRKALNIGLGALVISSSLANALSFTVTTGQDAGAGSLRQAILDANVAEGPDSIGFDAGMNGQSILLTSGPLEIRDDLTIAGPGPDKLVVRSEDPELDIIQISGSGLSVGIASIAVEGGEDGVQVSAGSNGVTVELTGLRVGRQLSDDAVSVGGSLNKVRITDSTLEGSEDNMSLEGTRNAVSVVGSSLLSAAQDGIEVEGDGNALLIERSTLSNNGEDASSPNDGIDIDGSNNTVELKQITISHNGEDGLDVEGPNNRVTIESATIAFNGRDGLKVQDETNTSSVVVHNTIIAQNDGPDVDGEIRSLGYNLIGDGTGSSGFGAEGDQVGKAEDAIDAGLGVLSSLGGTTEVHAPDGGSPVINAGDPNVAPPAEFDQRGPGFPRVLEGRIEIGAIEWAPR